MPATAAVYYHPDAYSIGRSDLKGRHAAGAGFLTAFARHHDAPILHCYTAERRLAVAFAGEIERLAGRPRPVAWIPQGEPARLADAGCLFLPGPALGESAWRRRIANARAYSLCGVTHTICSERVLDAFGDCMIAPVQPWDALIVTSNPARAAITTLLDSWGDYLSSRFGAPAVNPVRLPVIPLGVDCDRFADSSANQELGARLRQTHGIGVDDVVILFFGRLSFHAKAHPLAMFQACERAQARCGRRLHLMLTGAASNPHIEQEFREGARRYCPSVNTILLDGNDPAHALAPWFAADLFLSLSDNIQETFGLTPIEAMAAGLPVVVSDWDGYRDTVSDGEVGFRIPTLIPMPGASGQELAFRHMLEVDNFDRYIGAASQATAVDSVAAGEALARLADDPALRRRMGEAGRRRARALFDWPVVIAAYERLWEELAHLRATAEEVAPHQRGQSPVPLRQDPFTLFEGFASDRMGLETRLTCGHADPSAALDIILEGSMNSFCAATQLPRDGMLALLRRSQGTERGLDELLALFPKAAEGQVARSVGWLVKCGLLTARLV